MNNQEPLTPTPAGPHLGDRAARHAPFRYRREIDGLRALALIPVILFHGGLIGFEGGFVGVDVFFVISGYLITSLIVREKRAESFSILTFYERRARRILPALFVVTIACVPFAWLWMFPGEFKDFSQSAAAVAVFASNILFWQETGYFAPAADLKPLLHTWSLAVEEQYYLVFPLFVLGIWSAKRRWLAPSILAVSGASLLLAELTWRQAPTANFYLMPTRVWEFGVGALVALALLRYTPARSMLTELSAGAGLALLIVTIFAFDRATPTPSVLTLLPVAGTALVLLFASHDTAVGRLLGTKPLVGIGLISYSGYLWHQPLFAFARMNQLDELDPIRVSVLVAGALALAYPTWRFIEQPFRDRARTSRRSVAIMASGGTALLLAIGTFGAIVDKPESVRTLAILDARNDNNPRIEECRGVPPERACVYGDIKARLGFIAWGDSHIDQIMPVLDSIALQQGVSLIEYSFPGCPPVLDAARTDLVDTTCATLNAAALASVTSRPDVDIVIMHAYWELYFDHGTAASNRDETLIQAWERTVQEITGTGKQLIILGPVPVMPVSPPAAYAVQARRSGEIIEEIIVPLEAHRQAAADALAAIERTRSDIVTVIDPAGALCKDGTCHSLDGNGVILYRDANHLSASGSRVLRDLLESALEERLTE